MEGRLNDILQQAAFILKGHVLNPLWAPRLKRRQRRAYYNYQRVRHYLKKYDDFVKNLKIPPRDTSDPGKDKVFSIWFQGEENAPELVKVCFRRLRQVYGDRFVVLDKDTLPEWISLPEFVWEKWRQKKITYAHFSDICRVALLYQNGGIWFDATDFLTSKVPDWVEEADLFIYLAGDKITPESFIQSCFMRARKGQPLLGALLIYIFEYWQKEDIIVDYFLLHFMLRQLVENNSEAAEIFYGMPQIEQDPTHTLWHLHYRDPYSEDLYKETTKDSFFQKTTFKVKDASEPIPGSVADVIIKGEAPMPI